MNVSIEPGWKSALAEEFEKPYFAQLTDFVRTAYQNSTCYPKASHIFAAFDSCPLDQLKVVVIGQDPYHGPGQANGLCFSVQEGVSHPPSLRNIFKELETDINKNYPTSGDLSAWARQGVLLLNATLTVEAGNAGSHQNKGWEIFTDAVIKYISEHKKDVVFMLWGGFAKKKVRLIDASKHVILNSGHPSPLSANRGYWFGNKHFSKANDFLISKGETPIVW
jgi:uracil-DNA glycosylase